uniref:Major facilitator superfamily (MFS) profile domain-containing protein n=1 Tax=Branchiostoma floridae TaxID=7739 RepID=C3ZI74_BRAFL|eukprot:XP_002591805.1 hypothetical protein BRAFLDRAFT_83593 [Branchiostoma floridae]
MDLPPVKKAIRAGPISSRRRRTQPQGAVRSGDVLITVTGDHEVSRDYARRPPEEEEAHGRSRGQTRQKNRGAGLRHLTGKYNIAMTEGGEKITFWNRLCYSLSTIPNYMSQITIGLYLPVFLLEVVQLPPERVPIVTTTCNVLWALAFPLVGYLVNRTNTRWGKLKPWMFVAVVPTAVAYFFTWFSIGTSGETSKLVWYTFFACAFYVLSAVYGVPQNSLVMFATNEPKERDILNAFAVGGTILAMFGGSLIPGSTLAAYGAPVGYDPCTNGTNGTHPGASLAVQKQAFMVSASAIAGIYVLCGLVGVFGVPERKNVKPDNRIKSGLHNKSVIKHLFTFRPFICLLFISGFLGMAGTPSSVGQYLRYLVTIIPGGCYLLVLIIIIWFYPITEETRKTTKTALDFL